MHLKLSNSRKTESLILNRAKCIWDVLTAIAVVYCSSGLKLTSIRDRDWWAAMRNINTGLLSHWPRLLEAGQLWYRLLGHQTPSTSPGSDCGGAHTRNGSPGLTQTTPFTLLSSNSCHQFSQWMAQVRPWALTTLWIHLTCYVKPLKNPRDGFCYF